MAENSKIEWTNATWNPVTGCHKVSAGCANCYAERFAERWRGIPGHPYEQGFDLKTWPLRLNLPLTWKDSKRIFVNSMSDLFHQDIPLKFLKQVFETMNNAHWHQFQVLTKRADRLEKISSSVKWTKNIWMGVSVESDKFTYRIEMLKRTNAKIKFLSLEPLLSPLPNLKLRGIDWVIVGGESGPGARPMEKEWVVDIQKQCKKFNVPFFFKQWGGVQKKKRGRKLNGRIWSDMPEKKTAMSLAASK
ncbi:MAG TPA: phage Gp37/Gp68 family protein [bacterium]|nr:phage Gp37/Gp68 family protein [bacterium]